MLRTTIAVFLCLVSVEAHAEGALMFKSMQDGRPTDQVVQSNATPYQTVTFDSAAYDTGSYWNSERNCFQIPAGVKFAKFTGQAVFLTNGAGLRQLLVQRSDPGRTDFHFFPGVPIHNTPAVITTTTDISISSVILPVTEGECYALQPYQDSGLPVAISGAGGTFFAMEVIR